MGLIGNTGQAIKSGVVRKTAKLIEQSGRKVFLDPSVSETAKGHGIVLADSVELARMCDLLMVIGGDGTVLKVARDTAGSNTPLLGVNAGRYGLSKPCVRTGVIQASLPPPGTSQKFG